jgi:hypothetical protein
LDVMMMSLNEPHRQALGAIADGLAGSDPRLASMLNIFSRLAAGEEMPAREKTRVRRRRPAAHRPRHARRHPRRGTVFPQPRRLYLRLGWQRAMLLLWAVISAALVAVALALNTSGHQACIQSMGTACPASPVPQHAGASHAMNPPPLAEAFPHRQPDQLRNHSPGPTSAHDRQHRPANGGSGSPPGWLPAVSAAQSHP